MRSDNSNRRRPRSLLVIVARRKTGLAGLVILVALVLTGVLAPYIAPYDPMYIRPSDRLRAPDSRHFFGTDNFGRDILSRVMYGSRVSMLTGLSVALLSGIVGGMLGAVSAYFPRIGGVSMRLVDALMAFPAIILALFLMAITQRASLVNVIVALSVAYAPRMARTAFGLTLHVCTLTFIEAAEAVGSGRVRILLRHALPNLISPIIVQSTFTCALAILGAAALDFLGVGVPPSVPSWGAMVSEGRMYMTCAPWIVLIPGGFVAVFVLSLNLLGDAMRDALDPRLRRLR